MAILSALKPINKLQLISPLVKNVRWSGGHGREFPMRPSVFQWRKFKDSLHLYTMIGLIPLTVITTYVNVVVGPAQLAEIPEGYEPHHWEYFKSPISRFFARYLIRDKRIDYEMLVSIVNEESEKIILKQIEKQVKDFMALRSDYKSWYYRPIYGYLHRVEREEWKHMRDNMLGQHYWVKDETHFSDGGDPKP